MAVDAINVSELTYLSVIRHYLANLGTTMESQVTSSVYLSSVSFSSSSRPSPLSPPVFSLQSAKSSLDLSPFSCVLLCAAPPPIPQRPCLPPYYSPSRLLGP